MTKSTATIIGTFYEISREEIGKYNAKHFENLRQDTAGIFPTYVLPDEENLTILTEERFVNYSVADKDEDYELTHYIIFKLDFISNLLKEEMSIEGEIDVMRQILSDLKVVDSIRSKVFLNKFKNYVLPTQTLLQVDMEFEGSGEDLVITCKLNNEGVQHVH